jgi:hypothetical protein
MSQTMILMLAALGAELVLLALVLLGVAYLRNRAARRRDIAAVSGLVARVRQERPQRERAIEEFLAARLGYEGDALRLSTIALGRAELTLLQRFAALYRARDAALAKRFDAELYAALDAYHALGAATQAVEAAQADTDSAELEALRRENTRLSEELRITMETMSRMLNEYSTMFSGSGQTEDTAPAPAQPGLTGLAETPPGAEEEWQVALDASGDAAAVGDPQAAPAAAETGQISDAEDPLAQVLREAASQEATARAELEAMNVALAGEPGAAAVDAGFTAVADEGSAATDDDLFDSAAGAPAVDAVAEREPGAGGEWPEGPDELFELVEDEPRKSGAAT